MDYPCTQCGACCRHISAVVEALNKSPFEEDNALQFPYTWDENGRCENLTAENKCKVYDNRPLICNIEKFAEHLGIQKERYFQMNIPQCNKLMDLEKLPQHFRIPE